MAEETAHLKERGPNAHGLCCQTAPGGCRSSMDPCWGLSPLPAAKCPPPRPDTQRPPSLSLSAAAAGHMRWPECRDPPSGPRKARLWGKTSRGRPQLPRGAEPQRGRGKAAPLFGKAAFLAGVMGEAAFGWAPAASPRQPPEQIQAAARPDPPLPLFPSRQLQPFLPAAPACPAAAPKTGPRSGGDRLGPPQPPRGGGAAERQTGGLGACPGPHRARSPAGGGVRRAGSAASSPGPGPLPAPAAGPAWPQPPAPRASRPGRRRSPAPGRRAAPGRC